MLNSGQPYNSQTVTDTDADVSGGYIYFSSNSSYVYSYDASGGYSTWGSWLTAIDPHGGYYGYTFQYFITVDVIVTDNQTSEQHTWTHTYAPTYGW